MTAGLAMATTSCWLVSDNRRSGIGESESELEPNAGFIDLAVDFALGWAA
jgi:hypothetical protein